MKLEYTCRNCDREHEIQFDYQAYVDGNWNDTWEDEQCECGYTNVLEVNIETT